MCDNSTYFYAAFGGGFKEAEDQCLELSQDKVTVFREFNYWLHTGEMSQTFRFTKSGSRPDSRSKTNCDKIDDKDRATGEVEGVVDEQWHLLTELYIFADKTMVLAMLTLLMDTILDGFNTGTKYPSQIVPRIWEGTPAGSPFRRLMVDLFVYHASEARNWFTDVTDNYTRELLIEVSKA